jgi:hypothetical protein
MRSSASLGSGRPSEGVRMRPHWSTPRRPCPSRPALSAGGHELHEQPVFASQTGAGVHALNPWNTKPEHYLHDTTRTLSAPGNDGEGGVCRIGTLAMLNIWLDTLNAIPPTAAAAFTRGIEHVCALYRDTFLCMAVLDAACSCCWPCTWSLRRCPRSRPVPPIALNGTSRPAPSPPLRPQHSLGRRVTAAL